MKKIVTCLAAVSLLSAQSLLSSAHELSVTLVFPAPFSLEKISEKEATDLQKYYTERTAALAEQASVYALQHYYIEQTRQLTAQAPFENPPTESTKEKTSHKKKKGGTIAKIKPARNDLKDQYLDFSGAKAQEEEEHTPLTHVKPDHSDQDNSSFTEALKKTTDRLRELTAIIEFKDRLEKQRLELEQKLIPALNAKQKQEKVVCAVKTEQKAIDLSDLEKQEKIALANIQQIDLLATSLYDTFGYTEETTKRGLSETILSKIKAARTRYADHQRTQEKLNGLEIELIRLTLHPEFPYCTILEPHTNQNCSCKKIVELLGTATNDIEREERCFCYFIYHLAQGKGMKQNLPLAKKLLQLFAKKSGECLKKANALKGKSPIFADVIL